MNRAVVRADNATKLHSKIMKVGRDVFYEENELGGGAAGTLRYAEPFIESVGDAGDQGDSIRVNR